MTEDEIVGWHHRLNGPEFEQTPGDSVGQGSLACCSPWHTHTHTLKECLLWCGICLRHQGESATPICLDFLSKNQKQGTL